MTKNIKVLIILFPISHRDLHNLPNGLEILYVPHIDIKKGDMIEMNLPCTLNFLYLNHNLVDNVRVPYGCKIVGFVPKSKLDFGKDIQCELTLVRQSHRRCKLLKEFKTLYPDYEILYIHKFKHFFNLYLKK